MNSRALLARYLRQQHELGMPDIITSAKTLQTLYLSPVIANTATVAPALPHMHQQSEVNPAVAKTSTLLSKPFVPSPSFGSKPPKNRLAALRPVEQLIASAEKKAAPPKVPSAPRAPGGGSTDKRSALAVLYRTSCTSCQLSQSRRTFVFGAGSADAPVMVIGEAPGQDEDEQGLPFVGAAGKLLTTMLAAINLDRTNDVFITNILKCRPPENRSPESAEVITCMPLLRQQIDIIKPKALLLLGRIAAHAVLDSSESISQMRSKVYDYHGIPCMVIYHPAALLRNAEYKRPTWEDLKQFQSMLATSGIYGSLQKV